VIALTGALPLGPEPSVVVPLLPGGDGAATQTLPAEMRLRGLVDALPDGLVIADEDGRIVYANHRLTELSGWTAEELRGEPIELLVPERMRGVHEQHRDRFIAHPSVRPMGEGRGIVLRRKDGSEFPADISLSPLDTPATRVVLATIRDVTDRREAEERLRRSEERFRVLSARAEATNDLAQAILDSRDAEVLRILAGRGRSMVDADLGAVMAPADPGTLVCREVDGAIGEELRGVTVSDAGALAGEAMRNRTSLVTLDLLAETGVPRELAEVAPLGPALFVPLATDERVFGTLVVARRRGSPVFTAEHLRALELFAAQASVALEHGRIRAELQRLAVVEDRERIARELHDGIVQALFAVGLGLLSVEPLAAEEPVRGRLREAVDSIDRVIADLRRYIFGLKPQAVGMETLGHAVATLAHEFEGRTGILTALDTDPRLDFAAPAITGEVVQVAREALSNVARHAAATTCRVSLRYEAPLAVLEIDDDGRGFDTEAVPGHGYGLANLRERAGAVGGSVDVASQPGQGTTVRLSFPVEPVES
jgi:PAS domain S-box-containing protein